MQRWSWLVLVLSASACSKQAETPKKNEPAPPPPVVADAAPSVDAGFDNDVEPTSPPPAPTLSKGRGDCKLEYAPRPTRDPNMMCKVPGGTFMMGTNDPAYPMSQPAHAVKLDGFLIDRHEVTVAQIAFYLNTVKDNHCPGAEPDSDECFRIGGDPEQLVIKDGAFAAGAGMERMPIIWASAAGAERYCAWVGKRLVSDAQWEYAARHDPETGKDLVYPWGDRFEKNRTNCAEKDCADGFQRLAPVGLFDGSNGRGDDSSPFGVHDIAGNAAEITSTCFASHKPCANACEDKPAATLACKRVSRSASFSASKTAIPAFVRVPDSVGHSGIRCAAPL